MDRVCDAHISRHALRGRGNGSKGEPVVTDQSSYQSFNAGEAIIIGLSPPFPYNRSTGSPMNLIE